MGSSDPFTRIHRHAVVTSTNDVAAALAEGGAAEGHVVVADAQSGGRGRQTSARRRGARGGG